MSDKWDYLYEQALEKAQYDEEQLLREMADSCDECKAVFSAGGLLKDRAVACEAGSHGLELVSVKECLGCYASM